MAKEKRAMLMMAACACLWSIGGIFIKWISWNSFLIAGGRSLISALVLGGFMYVTKTKVTACRYSIGAGVSLAGCFFCFIAANKLTTAANAIILQYTAPVFILIISILFWHQKVARRWPVHSSGCWSLCSILCGFSFLMGNAQVSLRLLED